MYGGITIVAEVKMKSPFGFVLGKSWEEQFKLADSVGDIISIHTDSRWGGSIDLIKKARSLTSKPILAKGIHETDAQLDDAVKAGADYVFTVGRIPEVHKDICWVEPLSISQIKDIPTTMRLVWNTRDIKTGELKKETFEQARETWGGWMCQASHLQTIDDIKPGANAVLVGQNLDLFAKSMEE